jgi:hypothetical protein
MVVSNRAYRPVSTSNAAATECSTAQPAMGTAGSNACAATPQAVIRPAATT